MENRQVELMQFSHSDKTRFEPFFSAPSSAHMYSSLSPAEFERFLAYMFFCAGFFVENVANQKIPRGPGVDLNLYLSLGARRPFARIEARRYDPEGSGIALNDVLAFAGVLQAAGGVPGYLITTSHFPANARHVGGQPDMKDVHLVDGETLLRYISYVYGSRVTDGSGFHRTIKPILPDWLFNGLAQEPRSRARIITVANNKGGVGKTTTALNVGFALAAKGHHILLVDLDGQTNLTSTLLPPTPKGAARQPHQRAITEHFTPAQASLQELIQPTQFSTIWLLPANEELHRVESGGSADPNAELAFARSLRSPTLTIPFTANVPFDWIVVDTPPAISHFTRLALTAADFVLIPLKADSFTVAGINRALATARTMQALTNAPQARGIILTQWRAIKTMKDIAAKLGVDAALLGYPLFDVVIPYDDHIEQAHISLIGGGLKRLFDWPRVPAAQAYSKVADELVLKMR